MKTDLHLLNRSETGLSSDGMIWMHVCPLGEHPWTSADGAETILQVIDADACRFMAASYPLDGPSARVDLDHLSMDVKNTTEASAWGKFAEVRDDGLWVKAEPTTHGLPLINGKVYRFTSPCFPRDGLVDLGNGRFRVTKLGVIALTNDPNLRGQKPLTNSRAQSADKPTPTKQTMDFKTILLTLLSLPADASDDAITAAVSAAKGKDTTMQNRVTELETQLVNRDLDEHGITDVEQRKLLTPMLANKEQRTAALNLMTRIKNNDNARQALHNRNGAQVPNTDKQLSGGDADNKAAEAEKAKADWIGNRSRELKASNPNRSHRDCFSQAEADFRARA